jgi:hypothetical protein
VARHFTILYDNISDLPQAPHQAADSRVEFAAGCLGAATCSRTAATI